MITKYRRELVRETRPSRKQLLQLLKQQRYIILIFGIRRYSPTNNSENTNVIPLWRVINRFRQSW